MAAETNLTQRAIAGNVSEGTAKQTQDLHEPLQLERLEPQVENQIKELTQKAATVSDPVEREKLLREALDQEVQARTQGRTVKWLQSGTLQGAIGGAGVGGAIGTGLGTLTGTLVGATSSLAVGGVGAIIGSGVGAIHGPWQTVESMITRGRESVSSEAQARGIAVESHEQVIRETLTQRPLAGEDQQIVVEQVHQVKHVSDAIAQHESVVTKVTNSDPNKSFDDAHFGKPMVQGVNSGEQEQEAIEQNQTLVSEHQAVPEDEVEDEIMEENFDDDSLPVEQSDEAHNEGEGVIQGVVHAENTMGQATAKKKPRKLEVRSPKKSPRKLEIRSPKTKSAVPGRTKG